MANEKRLIDANKFGMHLADVQLANRGWKDDICEFLDDVMEALDEHPTVDAVEVVRCKDCKHWECWRVSGEGSGNCLLDTNGMLWNANDFCSYGERKDNEKTD